MLAKQEMIEYWLKVGVDLSGLNVQVLGLDSKDPNYLGADVYICSSKRTGFCCRDSDIRVRTLGDAFPFMRIYHNGDFESYVKFMSHYGMISVAKIHESIYCYLESSYSEKFKAKKDIVHLNEFLKIAKEKFHVRSVLRSSGGIGC